MSERHYNKDKQFKLLKKIQEVEFAAIELNLFLDNNPDNLKALADYNFMASQLACLKNDYEMEFGPLTNFGNAQSKAPWEWVNEPWPWENED